MKVRQQIHSLFIFEQNYRKPLTEAFDFTLERMPLRASFNFFLPAKQNRLSWHSSPKKGKSLFLERLLPKKLLMNFIQILDYTRHVYGLLKIAKLEAIFLCALAGESYTPLNSFLKLV